MKNIEEMNYRELQAEAKLRGISGKNTIGKLMKLLKKSIKEEETKIETETTTADITPKAELEASTTAANTTSETINVKEEETIPEKPKFYGGANLEVVSIKDVEINGKPLKEISLINGTTEVCSEEELNSRLK